MSSAAPIALSVPVRAPAASLRQAREDPWIVRIALTTTALLIIGVLIVIPVVNVFYEAFKRFSKREFPTFKTREEALDWLVGE